MWPAHLGLDRSSAREPIGATADAVRSNNWQNRPNPARSARPVLV